MISKRVEKFFRKLVFILALLLCSGFKVYPGIQGWNIDNTSAARRKVFVTLESSGQTFANNLPSTDSLAGSGSTLTEAQLLNSVLADYNNIQSSFLTLVTDADPDFGNYRLNHQIIIRKGSAAGLSSGEARPQFSGGFIVSCEISMTDSAYKDAKTFLHLLAHEIGHCLGLEHPQETVNAVMSYFHKDEIYRLAIDDKMGIVHLYPEDPSYAKEIPTYGLSCARKQ